ncbi:MAG: dihydropyrimidinase [Candidatus Eisenbacteria sp.]|nr:dihydropyrimidinase [Candidatus Eisenbacteria bacterium]
MEYTHRDEHLTPYDVIISGGEIVSGTSLVLGRGDIAIRGEKIARIAPHVDVPCRRRIDAKGLLVLPGLIDPHVHTSLPMRGTVSSDDPASATAAALFGGVTTIIDFTEQRAGQNLPESLRDKLSLLAGHAHTDYALHVNVTDFGPGFEERLAADLAAVVRLGAISFKVFPCYSKEGHAISRDHLKTLLKMSDAMGLLVLVHAENDRILLANEEKLLATGQIAPRDYPRSRPPRAEARAISDVIEAARAVDAAVYFVHVSTAGGLKRIVAGRQRASKPIYLETCPHYLILDESVYTGLDAAQFMVAPPLRAPEHREALLKGLGRGHVDVVATDHCPFLRNQKDRPGAPFTEIPNGLPGVETRLALLFTIAVMPRLITLERLVDLTSTNPAMIMGLYPRKGCIRPGSDADLVLFDPNTQWTIQPSGLHMNTDFSPHDGFKATGQVRTVLLRGKVVLENGALCSCKSGRYLKRDPQGLSAGAGP